MFGDVAPNKNKYIVHTWHRTGASKETRLSRSFTATVIRRIRPGRKILQPEEFYQRSLAFAEYWDDQLHDFVPASLPQNAWIDMANTHLLKELMTRPGGLYPKYGAVDRDYAGSEYDGFQDIFTSAIYTNMEWGPPGDGKALHR